MSSALETVQDKINGVHAKQLSLTRKLALQCGTAKNANFAARTRAIAQSGVKDFWHKVFKGHADLASQMMGEYDDRIFHALRTFDVQYRLDGFRIEMTFGPNDYFTDSVLWYDEVDRDGEEDGETVPTTSGVHWKLGKGPADEKQLAQEKSNPWAVAAAAAAAAATAGQRRNRDDEPVPEGRGPSFFTFFEPLPAPPQQQQQQRGGAGGKRVGDDAADSGDEDEDGMRFGDDEGCGDNDSDISAADDWDQDIDERREVARCLTDEIWEDPAEFLKQ